MQKRVSRIKRWRGEKKKIMFGSEGCMLMWNLPGKKKSNGVVQQDNKNLFCPCDTVAVKGFFWRPHSRSSREAIAGKLWVT